MPFGLQPIHLIFILLAALIIFGPKRLPEIGRGIGKALNEFRQGAKEMSEGFQEEISKKNESAPMMVADETAAPSPQDARIYCIRCGTSNLAGAHYCNHCGNALTTE